MVIANMLERKGYIAYEKHVIFDIDGTLLDSEESVLLSPQGNSADEKRKTYGNGRTGNLRWGFPVKPRFADWASRRKSLRRPYSSGEL